MNRFFIGLIKYILTISFLLFFAASILVDGFPQSLFNRAKKAGVYTVRQGEDLIAIAAKKQVKYLDLLAANGIGIADLMKKRVGEDLVIPRYVSAQDKQVYLSYQQIYLEDLKRDMASREADLDELNSRIASEKREIKYIQRRKMSKPALRNFSVRVENYNKLVKLHRSQYSEYSVAMNRMNGKIDEYNRLSESFNREEEQKEK